MARAFCKLVVPIAVMVLAVPCTAQVEDAERTTITNSLAMDLAWIPSGSFTMGSRESEKGREEDESPRHRVILTKGFYMGVTEVTQQQWEQLMGTAPWADNPNIQQGARLPAVFVTWTDAVSFCRRLSESEGRRYRLPTEAEWEYACRAGTYSPFYWGYAFDERYAWSSKNSELNMHEVGEKRPNAWGLFDMGGNVWEMCSDWYGRYPGEELTDPKGPDQPPERAVRVIRSGSYSNTPFDCRSAERGYMPPTSKGGIIGFRVVLEGEPPTEE